MGFVFGQILTFVLKFRISWAFFRHILDFILKSLEIPREILSWAHLDQILTFLEFHLLKSLELFTKMPLVLKGIIQSPCLNFGGLVGALGNTFFCYIFISGWILRFFRSICTWPTLIGLVLFCWHFLVWLGILFDWIAGIQHSYEIGCIGNVMASKIKQLRCLPPNSTTTLFSLIKYSVANSI